MRGPYALAAMVTLEKAGYVIVPKVPTEEMIQAGWIDKEDVDPDDIYVAMVEAATLNQS